MKRESKKFKDFLNNRNNAVKYFFFIVLFKLRIFFCFYLGRYLFKFLRKFFFQILFSSDQQHQQYCECLISQSFIFFAPTFKQMTQFQLFEAIQAYNFNVTDCFSIYAMIIFLFFLFWFLLFLLIIFILFFLLYFLDQRRFY